MNGHEGSMPIGAGTFSHDCAAHHASCPMVSLSLFEVPEYDHVNMDQQFSLCIYLVCDDKRLIRTYVIFVESF